MARSRAPAASGPVAGRAVVVSPASRQTWTEAVPPSSACPTGRSVEELLHRGVPRQIEHSGRWSLEVKATAGEGEPGRFTGLPKNVHIVAGGSDTLSEIDRWSCAELDLTAWLPGSGGRPGHHAWPRQTRQDFANPVKWDWQRRIRGILHQPFELGTYGPWRTSLKTDRADQALGFQL